MSRVVVTGVGGPAGRGLAVSLLGDGHRVFGVDARPVPPDDMPTALVPLATDPDYARVLLDELAVSWTADLVVPTVCEELTLPELRYPPSGVCVAVAPLGAAIVAGDKWLTAEKLRRAGIAVPRSARPEQPFEVAPGERWLVKPRRSRGGRGVEVHECPRGEVRVPVDCIVQEFAAGQEYAVQLFVPPRPDAAGLIAVFEKTALVGGIVGNAASVRRLPANRASDIERIAWQAACAVGLRGPADIDVRRRTDGTPLVLEINARVGAHIGAAPEIARAIVTSYCARPSARC